jgi:ribosomal protein L29
MADKKKVVTKAIAETVVDLRKKEPAALLKEIESLRVSMFENKQKLLRGEFKEIAQFAKSRKAIARMMTVLNEKKENNK